MKRIAIFILILFACLIVTAQALKPMSVASALRGTNGLLAFKPSTNQTTLVLGEHAPLDVPIRMAVHGSYWGEPNDVDIFDAIGGGQWKVIEMTASSAIPAYLVLECTDDNTAHIVSFVLDQGQYVWSISQTTSVSEPATVVIQAPDTTHHYLGVYLSQGQYVLGVDQSDSVLPVNSPLVRASDSTTHQFGMSIDQGQYLLYLTP